MSRAGAGPSTWLRQSPPSPARSEHVGLVFSGQAIAKMDDGTERLMKAGDLYVPPGHDSRVVGDQPYVLLHILGSEGYGDTPPSRHLPQPHGRVAQRCGPPGRRAHRTTHREGFLGRSHALPRSPTILQVLL
jgi:hypothetical protein